MAGRGARFLLLPLAPHFTELRQHASKAAGAKREAAAREARDPRFQRVNVWKMSDEEVRERGGDRRRVFGPTRYDGGDDGGVFKGN